MATVFRFSCVVFWFVWLVVFAYAIGISLFENRYLVIVDSNYDSASFLIKLVCFILIAYSVVGCVFVKCDISHLFCVFCYVIPLVILVPTLCIYGIVLLKNMGEVERSGLLDLVKTEWKAKQQQPDWLKVAEIARNCCGIFTYKDYQLEIYYLGGKGGLPPDYAEHGPQSFTTFPEVPKQCCANYVPPPDKSKRDSEHCLLNKILTSAAHGSRRYNPISWSELDPPNPTPDPPPKDLTLEMEEHLAYGTKALELGFPVTLPEFYNKTIVFLNGCGKQILQYHDAAREAHEISFVVMLVASILMFIVYIRAWYTKRRFRHGMAQPSDHSLDVERLSITDLDDDETTKSTRKSKTPVLLPPPPPGGPGVKVVRQSVRLSR